MSEVAAVDVPERYSHECRVASVRFLNRGTFQVELESSTGAALRYIAGHYLQLNIDIDGQAHSLFYSVANRPDSKQPGRLQLFIQNGSLFTEKLLRRLVQLCGRQEHLSVTLPMGRAFLQSNLKQPHLLVAAGSGISKIKCLAEEIVARDPSADVRVYWSNKNIDDFYLLEEFREWETQDENLSFTPILESEHPEWNGRTGFIFEVIQEDQYVSDNTVAYLCGSPRMVYGTIDQLAPYGLTEANCYSDVFEYAPRDKQVAV